jgi:hypothetical protein
LKTIRNRRCLPVKARGEANSESSTRSHLCEKNKRGILSPLLLSRAEASCIWPHVHRQESYKTEGDLGDIVTPAPSSSCSDCPNLPLVMLSKLLCVLVWASALSLEFSSAAPLMTPEAATNSLQKRYKGDATYYEVGLGACEDVS